MAAVAVVDEVAFLTGAVAAVVAAVAVVVSVVVEVGRHSQLGLSRDLSPSNLVSFLQAVPVVAVVDAAAGEVLPPAAVVVVRGAASLAVLREAQRSLS